MVKLPKEIVKKINSMTEGINATYREIGELEVEKVARIGKMQMEQQEYAQYWAQVCGEYGIDPSKGNYRIKDDGEVEIVEIIP